LTPITLSLAPSLPIPAIVEMEGMMRMREVGDRTAGQPDGQMDGWMDGTAIKLPLIWLSGNEPPPHTPAHARIYISVCSFLPRKIHQLADCRRYRDAKSRSMFI